MGSGCASGLVSERLAVLVAERVFDSVLVVRLPALRRSDESASAA